MCSLFQCVKLIEFQSTAHSLYNSHPFTMDILSPNRGSFSRGLSCRVLKLTTVFHLLRRLDIRGAAPPLLHRSPSRSSWFSTRIQLLYITLIFLGFWSQYDQIFKEHSDKKWFRAVFRSHDWHIVVYLKRRYYVDWINLSEGRVQWWAFLNTVMNLWVT
jgi:hypothetical protein